MSSFKPTPNVLISFKKKKEIYFAKTHKKRTKYPSKISGSFDYIRLTPEKIAQKQAEANHKINHAKNVNKKMESKLAEFETHKNLFIDVSKPLFIDIRNNYIILNKDKNLFFRYSDFETTEKLINYIINL